MNGFELRKAVLTSGIGHFIVLLFLLVAPSLPVFQPRMKVVWVELPRGASEEPDLNLKEAENLPQSTIQEQKEVLKEPEKPKPKEEPMVQPAPKPKPATKPKPAPVKKPLTREEKKMQEALSAIDKKLKQRKIQPEAAQIKDKGEGFKYGTGSQALRVPPTDLEYIAYQAKLRGKIIDEWVIPTSYLDTPAPPKARLVVMISKTGEILSTTWESRSGNPSFDASCLRAIQRASPLPTPPQRLEWEAYNEGFLIDFDPGLKQE